MSIKNPHIIHFVKRIKKKDDYLNQKWAYICIGSYTPEKSTTDKNKVTCFNCLNELGMLNKSKLRFSKKKKFKSWVGKSPGRRKTKQSGRKGK